MRAWCLLALAALACSTRRPEAEPAAAGPPAVELRAARGELLATLAPRAAGWELRAGNESFDVLVSASGAEVRDRAGQTVASLAPGAAGFALTGRDRRTLRVTFPQPHGMARVFDGVGVTIVAVDGATARDAASQIAATLSGKGDRLVVDGRDGARRGTVHNLPTHVDTPLAALLLATDTIDLAARAALVAYVLSR